MSGHYVSGVTIPKYGLSMTSLMGTQNVCGTDLKRYRATTFLFLPKKQGRTVISKLGASIITFNAIQVNDEIIVRKI